MKALEIKTLVDEGFRIPPIMNNTDEMLIVGRKLKKINFKIKRAVFKTDMEYFHSLNKFIEERLQYYRSVFPKKGYPKILDKYLCKRNSEKILSDGFFIGCGDICIVISSILKSNGYKCSLVYVVSECFSPVHDCGHTLVYVEKDGKSYLFDPSISKEVYRGYVIGVKEFPIKSTMGDLYIFAVTENPKVLGINSRESLRDFRKMAYKNWNRQKK